MTITWERNAASTYYEAVIAGVKVSWMPLTYADPNRSGWADFKLLADVRTEDELGFWWLEHGDYKFLCRELFGGSLLTRDLSVNGQLALAMAVIDLTENRRGEAGK